MDRKTFYVTKEKLQDLRNEYDTLVALERSETIDHEAPRILESEDLNPEFVSFRDDMNALRLRIEALEHIFDHYEIIAPPLKAEQAFVNLGARVKVDVSGKKNEFVIVGTLEANPEAGMISNESPVGKALLGKKVGDEVVISSPITTTYKIKEITYHVS